VRGHGTRRQLTYSVNAQPGEKVTFLERGRGVDRLTGTTKRSHGSLSFDRVHGAKQYVVLVILRDGLRADALVKHPSLRITVPTVGPKGGTVKVRALGNGLTTVD